MVREVPFGMYIIDRRHQEWRDTGQNGPHITSITYANDRAAQEAVGGINSVKRTTTGATCTSRDLVLNVYYRCTDETITNWWDGQGAKTKAAILAAI